MVQGPLEPITIDAHAAHRAVQSVRRALLLRDRFEKHNSLRHCDPAAFALGEALIGQAPIDDVLEQLKERHYAAKENDAWIRPRGLGMELAQDPDDKWVLPTTATLHGYRLKAFSRILADLKRARRCAA